MFEFSAQLLTLNTPWMRIMSMQSKGEIVFVASDQTYSSKNTAQFKSGQNRPKNYNLKKSIVRKWFPTSRLTQLTQAIR